MFAKTKQGYQRLIKIYTQAAQEGFYHAPRTDYKALKENWNDKDLSLMIPFYDSFLHLNTLHGYMCMPDLSFCDPFNFYAVRTNVTLKAF